MYLKTKAKSHRKWKFTFKNQSIVTYLYKSLFCSSPHNLHPPWPHHTHAKKCAEGAWFFQFLNHTNSSKTEYGKANKYNVEHSYSNITFIEYHKLCHVILNCPGKQVRLIPPILQRRKNTEMLSLVTQVVQGHTFRHRASSGFNALFS